MSKHKSTGEVLGQRMALLRRDHDEKMTHLAKAVGYTREYLSMVEAGGITNPSMDVVVKVANHYKVSIEWLIGEKDEETGERRLRLLIMGLSNRDKAVVEGVIGALANLP